jgi:integral membrane protein (TIGR01906 family)
MNKNKLLLIIFIVSILLFLTTLSYKVSLYTTELSDNQEQTINFLQNKELLQLNYTSSELSHLKDVKKVMGFIDYLFYFSLLVCTLVITYYRKSQQQLKKMFKYSGLTVLIIMGLILIISILSFNFMFTIFHQIFFPQGNWMFASNSLLIETFPIEFFISISSKIFLLTIIFSTGLLILKRYLHYKVQHKP